MTNIVVKNLKKSFTYHINNGIFDRETKTVQALNDISFEIRDGEIMGLVGANGAGKTTLVKIVAGVLKSDSGEVLIDGEDPFERSISYRKNVAMILGQKGKLHPDMSVLESADIYGAMFKISKEIIHKRVMEFAALLSLTEDDLSKQARSLSLGQRMKGEICLSFLNEPKVIFLDEPTLGLDIRSTKNIRHFLKDYCNRHRAVAILTSHNLGDIVQMSSKLLIIDKGNCVFYGAIDSLPSFWNQDTRIRYRVVNQKLLQDILKKFPKTSLDGNECVTPCKFDEIDETLNSLYHLGEIFGLKIEERPLETIIEELLHDE